ncbi:hypothetical protein CL630_04010 [bacterium]|nr:hypothetical protein [bacterium]|tara:strand:- start:82761 stop:83480 length:720 start_codon:yes stop_codon:yes gene_type:complete
MFKFFKDKSVFRCFTPEVMIATVIVESAIALYIVLRYHTTLFGRIAAAVVILLAFFQVAEYHICAGSNVFMWAQVGFVAITFLPVLGYHLILLVSGHNHFLRLGYALAFLFGLYFMLSPNALTEPMCGGNYIIFNPTQGLPWLFKIYYFGFLFLAIGEALQWIKNLRTIHGKGGALFWMIVGYLSFIVPVAFVMTTFNLGVNIFPSVACGFAIIFALILGLKVVPSYYDKHDKRKTPPR